jgi:hypothetical protein
MKLLIINSKLVHDNATTQPSSAFWSSDNAERKSIASVSPYKIITAGFSCGIAIPLSFIFGIVDSMPVLPLSQRW